MRKMVIEGWLLQEAGVEGVKIIPADAAREQAKFLQDDLWFFISRLAFEPVGKSPYGGEVCASQRRVRITLEEV